MDKKITGRSKAKQAATAVMERPAETKEEVRKVAYGLYEKRGYRHGDDWKDWFEAEAIIYNNKKNH